MSVVILGSSHVSKLEGAMYSLYSEGRKPAQATCIPADTVFYGVSGMTLSEFNAAESGRSSQVKRSLEQCSCKTVVLIAGGNDLDTEDGVEWESVLERFITAVEWLSAVFDSVLVVRLFHRTYPRSGNRSWHFKYPGRADYNAVSARVNEGLMNNKWSGKVYVCRHVKLTDKDLPDGVHLNYSALRKLLSNISRGLSALE